MTKDVERPAGGTAGVDPVMGGAGDPVAEIEQRVAAGIVTQWSLDRARSLWRER